MIPIFVIAKDTMLAKPMGGSTVATGRRLKDAPTSSGITTTKIAHFHCYSIGTRLKNFRQASEIVYKMIMRRFVDINIAENT